MGKHLAKSFADHIERANSVDFVSSFDEDGRPRFCQRPVEKEDKIRWKALVKEHLTKDSE